MSFYKNTLLVGFLLLFCLSSCSSLNAQNKQLKMQTIQKANSKEITRSGNPFDTVYIKKDTIYYWRNSEYQGKSILLKGKVINLTKNNSRFDSVSIKKDTMYYWKDNQYQGKSVFFKGNEIIKGNDKTNNEQSNSRITTEFDKRKVPFDSIYIKYNTMYYWRDNDFKGKTYIIKGKSK